MYWIYSYIQKSSLLNFPQGKAFFYFFTLFYFCFVQFFFCVLLLIWFTGTEESQIFFSREWQFSFLVYACLKKDEFVCVCVPAYRCMYVVVHNHLNYRKMGNKFNFEPSRCCCRKYKLSSLFVTQQTLWHHSHVHKYSYLHKHRSICRYCMSIYPSTIAAPRN